MVQAAYMDSNSTSLPSVKRESLSQPCATQSKPATRAIENAESSSLRSHSSRDYSGSTAADSRRNFQKSTTAPMYSTTTAATIPAVHQTESNLSRYLDTPRNRGAIYIPPAPGTEPYPPSFVMAPRLDEAVYIPPAPNTEPNLPSFVKKAQPLPRQHYHRAALPSHGDQNTFARAPPTPPDSVTGSWNPQASFASPKLPSEPLTPPFEAGDGNKHRMTLSHTGPESCKCGRVKRPSRMKRWKSAVKDLFYHEDDDEFAVEHIEITHWSEL